MVRIELLLNKMNLIRSLPKGDPNAYCEPRISLYGNARNPYTIKSAYGYFPDLCSDGEARAILERAVADWFRKAAKAWESHATLCEADTARLGVPITKKAFKRAVCFYSDCNFISKEREKSILEGLKATALDKAKMPYNQWEEVALGNLPSDREKRP